MKRKPTAFFATCQCGIVTGALDAMRTRDMGKILGKWLSEGYIVSPRFEGTVEIVVHPCRCVSGEKKASDAR